MNAALCGRDILTAPGEGGGRVLVQKTWSDSYLLKKCVESVPCYWMCSSTLILKYSHTHYGQACNTWYAMKTVFHTWACDNTCPIQPSYVFVLYWILLLGLDNDIVVVDNRYMHTMPHMELYSQRCTAITASQLALPCSLPPKAVKQKKFDFYNKLLWWILSPF